VAGARTATPQSGQGEEQSGRGWAWGWRLAAFAALLLLLTLLLQTGVVLLDPSAVGRLTAGAAAAACAAALIATWVMMSAVESRPPAALGLALSARAAGDLARGVVFGAVLIGLLSLLMLAAGWLDLPNGSAVAAPPVASVLHMTVLLALAALFEELAVRGYAFQVLASARGPAFAVVCTSVVFAALHGANPGVGWAAIGNTLLAGILLGILYWRTFSLWWVTGAHLAWNWTMGVGAGLPVSGLDVGGSLLGLTVTGPGLWTGGEYGPEAGLLLTLVTLAGIAWTASTPRLSRDPAVLALGPLVDPTAGSRRIESEEP
jgi:membrane protease YdiL (CAAX protease family)